MDKKTRNGIILFAVIIAAALLMLAGRSLKRRLNHMSASDGAAYDVTVSVDGNVIHEYTLNDDVDIVIDGINGGQNHLVIKDGQASVTEASCPDKICVNKGTISEQGETIVCLPNRVVVTVR